MFLDDRKKRILQAIVEDYVKYAEPIASKIIADKYGLDLSSATIRNEMAELEEIGLIEKMHTSSGRIPSDLGYRYYVDSLMKFEELSEEVLFSLALALKYDEDEILQDITKLLSGLTHYTAISIDDNDIFLYGRNNIFDYPEFRDIDKIKQFMYFLEEEELVRKMINSSLDTDINIRIGCENKFEEVRDCSMVTFPYKEGSIAVIGPKRMDYRKVVSYVKYLLEK